MATRTSEGVKLQELAREPNGALVVSLGDLDATISLGRFLAARARAGDLILLKGPLGVGKTTLARALIGAFLPGEEVPSPSFTLVQNYEAPGLDLVHYDLYRLESEADIFELGWEEAVGRALVIVEWPELLRTVLPADRLEVILSFGAEERERQAHIVPHGQWVQRLKDNDGV
jgi:tRNA threonylcarbamoyladenosine biosynthesis protein TsaE